MRQSIFSSPELAILDLPRRSRFSRACDFVSPVNRPPPRSPRVDAFAPAHLALSGSLQESPERLPKPPGSREPRRLLPSVISVSPWLINSPRAEHELKFLTQRHKATEKKKTKQGRRSGPFSDPLMTQIALIFKHQLPILSICENLCNLWMIPNSSLMSPVSGFQFQASSFPPSAIPASPRESLPGFASLLRFAPVAHPGLHI